MGAIYPFSRPLYVMVKPAGARCNMACSYCYYLEKDKLYRDDVRRVMSDEMLERFTRDYIQAQTMGEVLFTWHGGESLMRPLSFYQKAVELQKQYGRGVKIDNCIQTNGMLLNDQWCKFFSENGWLVGISIDGPQDFHDEYRRTPSGKPSFVKVMQGINLLNKWGVEWNAMAVVNDYNADYPSEFYQFFKSIGCKYIQFAPIVERFTEGPKDTRLAHAGSDADHCELAPFSITPEQWGDFLCALFDEWVREDVGQVYVQLFDATLANWVGVPPSICTLADTCGHAAVMEFNGDLYSCDHFVFEPYKLGNITQKTITEMMYSPQQLRFGNDKKDRLHPNCKRCEWLFACHGECPKNRFVQTSSEDPPLNYLCRGYKKFFSHVAPYMDYMKKEYMQQRPPANVMQAIKEGKLDR